MTGRAKAASTPFSHSQGEVLATPYLEKVTFKPFGPVDNGSQSLYGLDYKSAMWRGDEENPFHTEVGYWLWDGATGEVMRGFVVPRGITVLAGGTPTPTRRSFTLTRQGRRPAVLDRREQVPGAERVDAQLQRHHHHQRRRQLVVRRDHDAPDEGVPRAVRAHRPQHAAPGRLSPARPADGRPAAQKGYLPSKNFVMAAMFSSPPASWAISACTPLQRVGPAGAPAFTQQAGGGAGGRSAAAPRSWSPAPTGGEQLLAGPAPRPGPASHGLLGRDPVTGEQVASGRRGPIASARLTLAAASVTTPRPTKGALKRASGATKAISHQGSSVSPNPPWSR